MFTGIIDRRTKREDQWNENRGKSGIFTAKSLIIYEKTPPVAVDLKPHPPDHFL